MYYQTTSASTSTINYRSTSLQKYAGKKGTAARTRRAMRRQVDPSFNPESPLTQMRLNNTLFNERLSIQSRSMGLKEIQVSKLAYLMKVQIFSSIVEEKEPTLVGKVWSVLNTPIDISQGIEDVFNDVAVIATSFLIATPIAIKVVPLPEQPQVEIKAASPLVQKFIKAIEDGTRHLR